MPKFKDPKTGQIINVNYFFVFLSCLLFGLFFFVYIGETQHALVMVGLAILMALVGIFIDPVAILFAYIFPLIYSFAAPKIVEDKWLNKGYVNLGNRIDELSEGELIARRLEEKESIAVEAIERKIAITILCVIGIIFLLCLLLLLLLPS